MDPKRQLAATPPVKVVGFHVEGASPSPRPSTLTDAAGREVSSSPSPVIIPPIFQGQPGGGPTSPTRAPSAAPGDLEREPSASLPPIRTSSSNRLEDAGSTRTPLKSPASMRAGGVLPISPIMSASAAPGTLDAHDNTGAGVTVSPRVLASAPATSATLAATTAATPTSARTAAAAPLLGSATAAGGGAGTPLVAHPQQEAATPRGTAAAAQQPHAGGKAKAPGSPAQAQQAAAAAAGKAQKVQRHVEPPPKKELTRAERRAIQEAQRAAKAAAKAGQDGGAAAPKLQKQGSASNLSKQAAPAGKGHAAAAGSGAAEGRQAAAGGDAQAKGRSSGSGGRAKVGEDVHATKSTELFAHLPPYRKVTPESIVDKAEAASVPLEAVKLGLQYVDGSIRGANARCASMLAMLMHIIKEFKLPPGRGEAAKELLGAVNNVIAFLVACRPLSVTMGNAIKYIKCELERLKLQPALSEQQVKEDMVEKIGSYIQEKIRAADNLIVEHAIAKIQDGDVILTYSHSTLVASVLIKAHQEGRRFSVVVADARPQLEGRRLLRQLLSAGISCEYIYLNALSFMLDKVTKVFLGAGAVLSNGTVLSRVGSAAVAMMAAAERIPVLVCSETYKFHERVQLDSITQNELGDPEEVAHLPEWVGRSPLAEWNATERLGLLNLKYDAMPADFVSVVVTEAGLIPPTSVAVILRESRQDVLAV